MTNRQTIFKIALFILLAFLPIIANLWLIKNFDENTKKILFIQEKIENVYGFSGTAPMVTEVKNSKTLHLKKEVNIKNGDLIYFYKDQNVSVIADKKTEDILGIVNGTIGL